MKTTLEIILIVLCIFGIGWGGFTDTTNETVIDIGPIHATRERTLNVPLPPIAGGLGTYACFPSSPSCLACSAE